MNKITPNVCTWCPWYLHVWCSVLHSISVCTISLGDAKGFISELFRLLVNSSLKQNFLNKEFHIVKKFQSCRFLFPMRHTALPWNDEWCWCTAIFFRKYFKYYDPIPGHIFNSCGLFSFILNFTFQLIDTNFKTYSLTLSYNAREVGWGAWGCYCALPYKCSRWCGNQIHSQTSLIS